MGQEHIIAVVVVIILGYALGRYLTTKYKDTNTIIPMKPPTGPMAPLRRSPTPTGQISTLPFDPDDVLVESFLDTVCDSDHVFHGSPSSSRTYSADITDVGCSPPHDNSSSYGSDSGGSCGGSDD